MFIGANIQNDEILNDHSTKRTSQIIPKVEKCNQINNQGLLMNKTSENLSRMKCCQRTRWQICPVRLLKFRERQLHFNSVSNNQSRKYSRRKKRRLKEIYRSVKNYFSCRLRSGSSSSSENVSPLPVYVPGSSAVTLNDLRNRRQSYSTMQM